MNINVKSKMSDKIINLLYKLLLMLILYYYGRLIFFFSIAGGGGRGGVSPPIQYSQFAGRQNEKKKVWKQCSK